MAKIEAEAAAAGESAAGHGHGADNSETGEDGVGGDGGVGFESLGTAHGVGVSGRHVRRVRLRRRALQVRGEG